MLPETQPIDPEHKANLLKITDWDSFAAPQFFDFVSDQEEYEVNIKFPTIHLEKIAKNNSSSTTQTKVKSVKTPNPSSIQNKKKSKAPKRKIKRRLSFSDPTENSLKKRSFGNQRKQNIVRKTKCFLSKRRKSVEIINSVSNVEIQAKKKKIHRSLSDSTKPSMTRRNSFSDSTASSRRKSRGSIKLKNCCDNHSQNQTQPSDNGECFKSTEAHSLKVSQRIKNLPKRVTSSDGFKPCDPLLGPRSLKPAKLTIPERVEFSSDQRIAERAQRRQKKRSNFRKKISKVVKIR